MRCLLAKPRLAVALMALFLAGCGDDQTVQTITDVRTRTSVRYDMPADITPARRYGYRMRGEMGDGHGAPAVTGFGWQTPEGWEEKPRKPGSIRLGSWTVTGEPRTDCSLVSLAGDGGGLLLNVNRWRGEMGAEPITAAELEELPQRTLLQTPATYVDIAGRFSGGQSSGGPVEDARMLGIILSVPRATLFIKFTGPSAVVEAQRAAFEALADSISFGVKPPVTPNGTGTDTPPRPGTFAWDAPESWQLQPSRMSRIATFVPEGHPTTWCYASKLGGHAGGLVNNVNRWRGEMGARDTLDEAAVGKLPTLDVLGKKAVLLDLKGNFAGTGGPPQKDARMLGVICPRENDIVFIKMVGPAATLDAQYDAFVAFCTSLREAQ